VFYRWDYDGDGSWDTDYDHSVISFHQYDRPGTFQTRVEVLDPHGGADTCSIVIHISSGSNITGLYTDTRGYIYQSYGTVLIGSQWWFTRNMTTQDTAEYYKQPVLNNWPAYFDYGDLYTSSQISSVCPPGWRVPSKDDWNKLFANYPENELFDALMPGGVSDLGINPGGMGIGVYATSAKYRGLDLYGYYWSATKPLDATSASIWVIAFDLRARNVLRGYDPETNKMYSVRCMKDQ
jgi:uncharacterized protein (TIGR02145 family)